MPEQSPANDANAIEFRDHKDGVCEIYSNFVDIGWGANDVYLRLSHLVPTATQARPDRFVVEVRAAVNMAWAQAKLLQRHANRCHRAIRDRQWRTQVARTGNTEHARGPGRAGQATIDECAAGEWESSLDHPLPLPATLSKTMSGHQFAVPAIAFRVRPRTAVRILMCLGSTFAETSLSTLLALRLQTEEAKRPARTTQVQTRMPECFWMWLKRERSYLKSVHHFL